MMYQSYMSDPDYIAFQKRQNRLDERTADKLFWFIRIFFGD